MSPTATRRRAPSRTASTRRHTRCRDTHSDVPRLQRLLEQRDRLADHAHQSDAHGYPDAADAWQILGATEDAIRHLDPRGYRRRAEKWAEQDAQRAHTPDDPHPATCATCRHHKHGPAPRPAA